MSGRCVRLELECEGYEDLTFQPVTSKPVGRFHERVIRPRETSVTSSIRSDISSDSASPESIVNWISSTMSPFQDPQEIRGLQTWLETMKYMGRSDLGLSIWTRIVPSLAWSYDSVRHMQTATAMILDSLRLKEDPEQYRKAERLSLQHAQKAVQAVVRQNSPVEVRIVVSMILWMYQILAGQPSGANQHVVDAYTLAQQTDLLKFSEPLLGLYCRAFIGEITPSINPMRISQLSKEEQKSLMQNRTRYSKDILIHAVSSCQSLVQAIDGSSHALKSSNGHIRARGLIQISETALNDVSKGWPHKAFFTYDPETGLPENQALLHKVIQEYSPFHAILQYIEEYFLDLDERHLTNYHLQFRPCLDIFMWLAAGVDISVRKAVMPLWNVSWAISPRASTIVKRVSCREVNASRSQVSRVRHSLEIDIPELPKINHHVRRNLSSRNKIIVNC